VLGESESSPEAGFAGREAQPTSASASGEEGGSRGKHGFPRVLVKGS
jgi:hypothetical protein